MQKRELVQLEVRHCYFGLLSRCFQKIEGTYRGALVSRNLLYTPSFYSPATVYPTFAVVPGVRHPQNQ